MARLAIRAAALLPLLLPACGGPPRLDATAERLEPGRSAAAPAPACSAVKVDSRARLHVPPGTDPVAAWNHWAHQEGLQDDLLSMLALALPDAFPADVSVRIVYEPGEQPNTAAVTVVHEGLLDDSIRGERFELRFDRLQCPTCDGPSRWKLSSWARAWSCREGRGHTDFGTEPCI